MTVAFLSLSSSSQRTKVGQVLEQRLDFQWPLKPYGTDKNLDKTALMNIRVPKLDCTN